MPRGRRANQGVETPPPEEDDDDFARALLKSQEDYEKAETLRKKEEEDLMRAINESLKSNRSNDQADEARPSDDSFRLQLDDDTPPIIDGECSSSELPESSGLLTIPLNPFGDLQDLESLADPSSVAAPVENPTNDPQTQAKKAPTNLTTTNSKSPAPRRQTRSMSGVLQPKKKTPKKSRKALKSIVQPSATETKPTQTIINNNTTNNVNNITVNTMNDANKFLGGMAENIVNAVRNVLGIQGTSTGSSRSSQQSPRTSTPQSQSSASRPNTDGIQLTSPIPATNNSRAPNQVQSWPTSGGHVLGTAQSNAGFMPTSNTHLGQASTNNLASDNAEHVYQDHDIQVGQEQEVQSWPSASGGQVFITAQPNAGLLTRQAANLGQTSTILYPINGGRQSSNAANRAIASTRHANSVSAVRSTVNAASQASTARSSTVQSSVNAANSAASQASTARSSSAQSSVNASNSAASQAATARSSSAAASSTSSAPSTNTNPATFAIPSTSTNGHGNGRGTRRGGRGRGNRYGRGKGVTNGSTNKPAGESIIIPSSTFQVAAEEEEISSSNIAATSKRPKRAAGKKVDYESDEDDHDASGIEEFATSFMEEATLHTINRNFAKDSRFADRFAEIDTYFESQVQGMATIESIVTTRNEDLERKYEQKRESFAVLDIPTTEKYLYYNSYSGNSKSVLWNIVKRHFKPLRNHDGRMDYGKGVYLFERPDLAKTRQSGVVICKALIGKSHRVTKASKDAIPKGHHSKFVDMKKQNSFYVLTNADQILPIAVIHCSSADESSTSSNAINNAPALNPQAEQDRVNKQMAKLFEKSLRLHLTGQYMMASRAITTRLYPHQMYALAWMANRENKNVGVCGGILADDMGLGKTLTVLSLIMTNFHDKRPLARPMYGFHRKLTRETLRYMPQTNLKSNSAALGSSGIRTNDFRSKKDTKGRVKGAKRKYNDPAYYINNEAESSSAALNDTLPTAQDHDDDEEKDEFDSLIDGKASYSERLGIDSSTDFFNEAKRKKFFDDLSDDEEYQNMTEEQRNEKMAPKLNLDGAITDESGDDEEITSSTSTNIKKKRIWDDDFMDDEDDIPDFDITEDDNADQATETSKANNPEELNLDLQLTEQQKKNLIKPPAGPAILGGRRRTTLIVTPASLIGHWLEQIQRHVDKSVNLSIFVHHGVNKAMLATELQDNDIVLTTYGTLQSEFNDNNMGPLLRAQWLRVCLDEGHYIKNHNSKTAKAAANLDTQRKWIISGTPIQNNLGELWSLLVWLEEPHYGQEKRFKFKNEIETPVKNGYIIGVIRLQAVVDAVCLRRTKADEIDGKPLVTLPPKTVNIKELEFTREEQIVYDAYHKQARKIIEKYMKKKSLLKNYAHVFAIMMRLRQLCCHRGLVVDIAWNQVNIEDIEELIKEVTEGDEEENEEDEARTKELAERLRDMIREGISDECSICLTEFDRPVITPCAHIYCRPCITQLIETHAHPPAPCPLCRGPLELRSLLEAAKDEDEADGNAEDNNTFEDIIIDVSSTKVNACLQHLATLRRDKPGDKVIIVSQFTSLLSMLQPLLENDGYKYGRLDGTMSTRQRSEVIANFQDTSVDAPTVLLLSLRAGGVGLNLNVANHMILLDPAWNPSTEDQCFDRIHRLGQTKEVEITRFVMKNSIEMKMLDIQERKKDLISGAFRQTEAERRERRLQDIRDLFGISNDGANTS